MYMDTTCTTLAHAMYGITDQHTIHRLLESLEMYRLYIIDTLGEFTGELSLGRWLERETERRERRERETERIFEDSNRGSNSSTFCTSSSPFFTVPLLSLTTFLTSVCGGAGSSGPSGTSSGLSVAGATAAPLTFFTS